MANHRTQQNRPGEPAPLPPQQPDHSMLEEEPLDEGPLDIDDPQKKRHPRTEGKGGLPDPGDAWRKRAADELRESAVRPSCAANSTKDAAGG